MKQASVFFFTVTIFLISVVRLPAPIVEESPIPTAAPKSKTVESQGAALGDAKLGIPRFVGTWQTVSTSTDAVSTSQRRSTLVIVNGGKARWSQEATYTLLTGKTWPSDSLPSQFNTLSPIFVKLMDESKDLKIEGPNLTIHWPVSRLVDWSPKSIPRQALEKGITTNIVTYILQDNRLTSTDGTRTAIWQRVK